MWNKIYQSACRYLLLSRREGLLNHEWYYDFCQNTIPCAIKGYHLMFGHYGIGRGGVTMVRCTNRISSWKVSDNTNPNDARGPAEMQSPSYGCEVQRPSSGFLLFVIRSGGTQGVNYAILKIPHGWFVVAFLSLLVRGLNPSPSPGYVSMVALRTVISLTVTLARGVNWKNLWDIHPKKCTVWFTLFNHFVGLAQ